MSPRPYNLGKRADDIDRGRRQILDAARSAFREATSYTAFTLDAVAKRADVARGTVYYQFGSKVGLLEAVCDDLGASGGLADLSHAFSQPEPATALAEFIACFGRFWDADRAVMRRLRALAALDPDVHAVIAARDQRRHDGLGQLLARFEADPRAREADRQPALRALLALTSFETYDTLAGPTQDLAAVTPQVVKLATAVINQMTAGPVPG
ncbi:MAG: TetR/AcrR family transcriptional regulator [Actinomycetota bacterium]|jgi:AcrR family transcriptional regulator|nr:TetR/AcrR family transcriptional regulator [Actinomycetota bacterium]MDA8313753.1 TetR/AcrR family transcriptional regulator [Actinomycetota bacterium]